MFVFSWKLFYQIKKKIKLVFRFLNICKWVWVRGFSYEKNTRCHTLAKAWAITKGDEIPLHTSMAHSCRLWTVAHRKSVANVCPWHTSTFIVGHQKVQKQFTPQTWHQLTNRLMTPTVISLSNFVCRDMKKKRDLLGYRCLWFYLRVWLLQSSLATGLQAWSSCIRVHNCVLYFFLQSSLPDL